MINLEIIGNIGQDAVINEKNGRKFVSFNVASTERRTDAQGNAIDSTTWVTVTRQGDGGALTQHLKKGVKVFVRGKMSISQYQNKQGQWQAGVNVFANEIELCGIKSDGTGANAQQADPNDARPF